MSDKEWDQIVEVHLKGSFACSKAAWPHFRKQKFGRIVNTASAAGLYGTDLSYGTQYHAKITNFRQLWSGQLQRGKDGTGGVHENPRARRCKV